MMRILKYIILLITYLIGYIIFIKLNKSKLDNTWKYGFIFNYSAIVGIFYFIIQYNI